jgi:NAD(P)-dependent dehydrogenase (short-subunit alcohol dehydrogenase family)
VPAGAEESSMDQVRAIFDTNFFGIVRMTRAVVPHMRRQGSGRIINIGSVLGFLPMPYAALYAATKHAVEGYSESLDHELRTRGIRVSVIEPAYTKTQFDANFAQPDARLDEYREIRAALVDTLNKVMATADEPGVVAGGRAQGRERGASEAAIHGRRRRGTAAISSQIRAGWRNGRRYSQRPPVGLSLRSSRVIQSERREEDGFFSSSPSAQAYQFSFQGRSTTSNAQVDLCCR